MRNDIPSFTMMDILNGRLDRSVLCICLDVVRHYLGNANHFIYETDIRVIVRGIHSLYSRIYVVVVIQGSPHLAVDVNGVYVLHVLYRIELRVRAPFEICPIIRR